MTVPNTAVLDRIWAIFVAQHVVEQAAANGSSCRKFKWTAELPSLKLPLPSPLSRRPDETSYSPLEDDDESREAVTDELVRNAHRVQPEHIADRGA